MAAYRVRMAPRQGQLLVVHAFVDYPAPRIPSIGGVEIGQVGARLGDVAHAVLAHPPFGRQVVCHPEPGNWREVRGKRSG